MTQSHGGVPGLRGEVLAASAQDVAKCYQCAKCSAGCPMAEELPLRPHQMMRLVQLDERERLFASDAMWLCLTCETCTTRCPNGCDPARVIDALRELVLTHDPDHAPRPIRAFHHAFLKQIRKHGRVFEFGLVASYKLRSGALFADVGAAPGMFARGKLALTPRTIKGVADVRRIFDACAPHVDDADAAHAAPGTTEVKP